MITNQNINELVSITMKNMPLPSIENMLSIPCNSDFDINCIVGFMHKHYSAEDILKGLDAHFKHCKLVARLFENKK